MYGVELILYPAVLQVPTISSRSYNWNPHVCVCARGESALDIPVAAYLHVCSNLFPTDKVEITASAALVSSPATATATAECSRKSTTGCPSP